jgi:hypothetical protein
MSDIIRPIDTGHVIPSTSPIRRVHRRDENEEQERRREQREQLAEDDVPTGDPGAYDDHGRRSTADVTDTLSARRETLRQRLDRLV